MKLIALVTILAVVGGVRTNILPGEPIPDDMSPSDITDLKDMKSIVDLDDVDADRRMDESFRRLAARDFEEARERVQAQRASLTAGLPVAVIGTALAEGGSVEGLQAASLAPVVLVGDGGTGSPTAVAALADTVSSGLQAAALQGASDSGNSSGASSATASGTSSDSTSIASSGTASDSSLPVADASVSASSASPIDAADKAVDLVADATSSTSARPAGKTSSKR